MNLFFCFLLQDIVLLQFEFFHNNSTFSLSPCFLAICVQDSHKMSDTKWVRGERKGVKRPDHAGRVKSIPDNLEDERTRARFYFSSSCITIISTHQPLRPTPLPSSIELKNGQTNCRFDFGVVFARFICKHYQDGYHLIIYMDSNNNKLAMHK